MEVGRGEIQARSILKEHIQSGREITVGALKFCSFAEQNKASGLLTAITTTLQDKPDLDLLVTPEFSLHYPSEEFQECKKTGEEIKSPKTDFVFNIPGVEVVTGKATKADSRKPFVFRSLDNGGFDIADGDPELIQILKQILQLAKQFKTNILLGTVSEKQVINGHEVIHNTLLVINNGGKIVRLRRKITSEVTDYDIAERRVEQAKQEKERVFSDQLERRIEDEEARKTLQLVTLSNKNGDRFTVLPLICRERGSIKQYLQRDWGGKIDVVTVSISEGDDLISKVQQAMTHDPKSESSLGFKTRYRFDMLKEHHNPHAMMIMTDEVKSAVGCFAVDDTNIEVQDKQSVLIVKHNLG
jgi:hypothetical protein